MRRLILGVAIATTLVAGVAAVDSRTRAQLPPPVVDASVANARILVDEGLGSEERGAIAATVERDVSIVETAFSRPFVPAPRVFVYGTASSFALGVGARFEYSETTAQYVGATYGGIFDRGSLAIALNWHAAPPDRMSAAVTHELVHLMLDEATDGAPLPTWFDEGMATVFEEDFAAGTMWSIDEVVTGRALAGSRRVALADLDALVGWHAVYARAGRPLYAFAADVVRAIEVRVGWDGVSRVLRAVHDGAMFEDAYEAEAGETTKQLEARVRAAATPTIVVDPNTDAIGDHPWTMYTGSPSTTVLVSIARPLTGYLVTFTVLTDDLGLYRGSFGSTVSPGAYTISAAGVDAVVVVSR